MMKQSKEKSIDMMISSSSTRVLIFSITLTLILTTRGFSSARFSTKITSADIDAVCSKTQNPPFCSSYLASDPRTAAVNLSSVESNVLDDVSSKAAGIRIYITALVRRTTDQDLKEAYKSCSDHYYRAGGDLEAATEALGVGDFRKMKDAASSAFNEADGCLAALKNVDGDGDVAKTSSTIKNLCDIISVIAGMLSS